LFPFIGIIQKFNIVNTRSVPKVFKLSSYGISGIIYINKVAPSSLKFRSQIL